MKKTFFMVALVVASMMCFDANAQTENQYAAELEFTQTEFVMDSVRFYNATPEQLLVELNYLQDNVKKDGVNIKKAMVQLKDERTLLKNLTAGMKDSKKHIEASDKLIRQEQKELTSVTEMLEKQLGNVHKSTRVSKAVRNRLEDNLDAAKLSIKKANHELEDRLKKIADLKKNWEAMSDKLMEYDAELTQKDAQLNTMMEKNKQQTESLKLEVKTINEQIKAAKAAK